MMKPTLLALIPARQHSSRLPEKNLQVLGEKPLIVHTIDCALQCRSIDRIIVSTDSPVIKDIARRAGADVPFLRPAELAGDTAATKDVVAHAVHFLSGAEDRTYDYFAVLQPTSPLRIPADIDAAFQLLHAAQADSIVSVSAASIPASHLVIEENGLLRAVTDCRKFPPDQTFLKLNGAIYISRMDVLIKNDRLLGERVIPYFMPESRSVDIDSFDDFYLAETLLKDQ